MSLAGGALYWSPLNLFVELIKPIFTGVACWRCGLAVGGAYHVSEHHPTLALGLWSPSQQSAAPHGRGRGVCSTTSRASLATSASGRRPSSLQHTTFGRPFISNPRRTKFSQQPHPRILFRRNGFIGAVTHAGHGDGWRWSLLHHVRHGGDTLLISRHVSAHNTQPPAFDAPNKITKTLPACSHRSGRPVSSTSSYSAPQLQAPASFGAHRLRRPPRPPAPELSDLNVPTPPSPHVLLPILTRPVSAACW